MAEKRCQICGTSVPLSYPKCTNCGHNIDAGSRITEVRSETCVICGALVAGMPKICVRCGWDNDRHQRLCGKCSGTARPQTNVGLFRLLLVIGLLAFGVTGLVQEDWIMGGVYLLGGFGLATFVGGLASRQACIRCKEKSNAAYLTSVEKGQLMKKRVMGAFLGVVFMVAAVLAWNYLNKERANQAPVEEDDFGSISRPL
jgi:hypothetical protein